MGSPADEELIDKAVAELGGYDALDHKLKKIFHRAILEGFQHAQEAKDILTNDIQFQSSVARPSVASGTPPCGDILLQSDSVDDAAAPRFFQL